MEEEFQDMNRTWLGRRGLRFLDGSTHISLEPV